MGTAESGIYHWRGPAQNVQARSWATRLGILGAVSETLNLVARDSELVKSDPSQWELAKSGPVQALNSQRPTFSQVDVPA